LNTIVYDKWLSVILGKKAYAIVDSNFCFERVGLPGSNEYRHLAQLVKEPVFIYAKVPSAQKKALALLQSYEFRVVETSLLMHRAPQPGLLVSGRLHVRRAIKKDETAICELAGRSFSFSRFHRDSAIDNALADKIKVEWTRSYFKGQRGDAMFVAIYNVDIVGFVLLIDKAEDRVGIDLMAVDAASRRTGIATALISAVELHYKDKQRITVGTQAVNIPSVRFYKKRGFRLFQSRHVLHYHGPGLSIG